MASRSCCALRARRRPWEAAGSFSHHHGACGAGTTRRSLASAACGRPILSSACVPPWRSSGSAPGPSADSARSTGLAGGELESALAALTASGALVDLPVGPRRTVRVLAEYAADLEERALRALGRLHAARPRHSAIPRAQLAAAFPDLANEALAAGLIERLKAQGKVVADSRTVALRGFQPKLSQGERKLKAELAETIRSGGMSPPDAAELAAAAGPRGAPSPTCSPCCATRNSIVEINAQLYLDAEVEARAARARQRTARRRLGDHDVGAARPAGHDPQVRGPHRRIPRPHRLDQTRRRRAPAGARPRTYPCSAPSDRRPKLMASRTDGEMTGLFDESG